MAFTTLPDHLEKVRHFLQVARSGSFRRAAVALRLSQPSLSRSVKILEGALERPLLRRTRQGVQLTPAGRVVLRFGERVEGEVARLEHELKDASVGLRARLEVGSFSSLAIRVWPELVRRLALKHPGISIALNTSCDVPEMQRRLVGGQLDLVLAVSPRPRPELGHDPLYRDTFRLYGAPSVAARLGKALRLADHPELPLILVPSAAYDGSATLEELAVSLGITRARAKLYELDSFEAAREFVEAGIGVGFLPRWVAEPAERRGQLVELRARETLGGIGRHLISLAYRREDAEEPAILAVRREARELLVGGPQALNPASARTSPAKGE